MARYNTVTPVAATTTTATIASPSAGLITTFTGTAPYTVTLPSPVLYSGSTQLFWNNTAGVVTVSTPSGVIRGPGSSAATTWPLPTNTVLALTSNGTDYVVTENVGGILTATSGNFSGNLAVTGTATLTVGGTATFNGSSVSASSAFTPSTAYHLITKTYLETEYGKPWATITGAYTAVAGDRLFVDTTSVAITVTLPAAPAVGDMVQMVDYAGTFAARALTVGNNGLKIMRQTDVMTVATTGAAFTLVYSGAAMGWLMDGGI